MNAEGGGKEKEKEKTIQNLAVASPSHGAAAGDR
jgi:hypothetical protein